MIVFNFHPRTGTLQLSEEGLFFGTLAPELTKYLEFPSDIDYKLDPILERAQIVAKMYKVTITERNRPRIRQPKNIES